MNPKISRFVKICFGDDHYGGYSVADQTEDEIDYTYQACIVKFVFIDSFYCIIWYGYHSSIGAGVVRQRCA